MKTTCLVLSALLLAAAGCAPRASIREPVIVTGTATDCSRGEVIKLHGLEVRAFDPSRHQVLVTLLRSMDTVTWVGDGVESMARFEPMYGRMRDLLQSSTPAARDSTTQTGTFRLSVPASDSVLVIGQADLEDEPIYYAYKMLNGRYDVAFELDMSRGGCARRKSVADKRSTEKR